MTLLVIITIYGVTIQSCSGAWVWLIIILVIVSCTDLSLYFFTPVQQFHPTCLCTLLHLFNSVPFLIFWKIFVMSSFTSFLLSPGLILHYILFTVIILNAVCSVYTWYDGFCETVIYIIQQPHQLEWETVSWMPLLSQTWTLNDLNWGPPSHVSLWRQKDLANTCQYHSRQGPGMDPSVSCWAPKKVNCFLS